MKGRIKNTIEFLLLVALTAALFYLPNVKAGGMTIPTDSGIETYYQQSIVTAQYQPEKNLNMVEYCYLTILHSAFFIFGNSYIIAQMVQIALTAFCALLIHRTIRVLAGREISMLCMMIFTCLCYIRRDILFLRPMILFVLLCSILIFAIVHVSKAIFDIRQNKNDGEETQVTSDEAETFSEKQPIQIDVDASPLNLNIFVPKQIPNVLPMPKKHERKGTIDFEIEVSKQEMHFDVDTNGNDDFDI